MKLKAKLGRFSSITGLPIIVTDNDGQVVGMLPLINFPGDEAAQREVAEQLIRAINGGPQIDGSALRREYEQARNTQKGRTAEEQAEHSKTCLACTLEDCLNQFAITYEERTGLPLKTTDVTNTILAIAAETVVRSMLDRTSEPSMLYMSTYGWLVDRLHTLLPEIVVKNTMGESEHIGKILEKMLGIDPKGKPN